MSTVSTAFEKAHAEDRAALVGYLPAGFPDKETAIRAALAMCEAGADVIEVGLPYSDPLMDGPVIADAVYRALKGGTRIADVLDTVERDRRRGHRRAGHDLLEPGRQVRRRTRSPATSPARAGPA